MKNFQIIYEPRIEDPVVVASFATHSEAVEYLELLKESRPKHINFAKS